MKKIFIIIFFSFAFFTKVNAQNITILFGDEKEVHLLSKQTPLSDKVYFRANIAGEAHCKKYKKFAFRSALGMKTKEIARYYKSKGYKIGKGFSKKPQLLHFICSKTPISYIPSGTYDAGHKIDWNNYGEVSVARLIEEEKNKKKVEEKRRKEEERKRIAKKEKERQAAEEKKKPKRQVSSEIDPSLITIGSGSGFFINSKGYALTNNHVIEICKQSVATINGKEILFKVLATDITNDVALIKADLRSKNYIKINEHGAELGENVIAVGYPLAGRLSDSVKITRGIVSSLTGINNNIGQIQIDAALQPGNSGGPVLNEKGELVGIASAGLNKLLMAKEASYIPENVNFAVASPIVTNILKSQRIKFTKQSFFSGSFSNTELAELGNDVTIQLFCRNTRLAYNKLKSTNEYSTVLLDIE